MLDSSLPFSLEPAITMDPGAVVFRRGEASQCAVYLMKGRVLLGVMHNGHIFHLLGAAEGPFWLEAAACLLGLPHAVDAVAETSVELQFMAAPDFVAEVKTLPQASQNLLMDMARSQRQQTEMSVSRWAKDAEARCAEWLLRHAETADLAGGLAVKLIERKRSIAAQLGMAPETFSRVLRHLRERHLISGGGRLLGLPDPQALRELAGG